MLSSFYLFKMKTCRQRLCSEIGTEENVLVIVNSSKQKFEPNDNLVDI